MPGSSDIARGSLHENRPDFGPEGAVRLARDAYGFEGDPRELPSERDQNFLITAPDGQRRLVKIAQHGEDPLVLDLQQRVLERLAASTEAARIPVPVTSLGGAEVIEAESPTGRPHLVRMLNWLPGRPLAGVTPHSPVLLEDLGRLLGGVDRALEGFTHPAMDRPLRWDLARGHEVVPAYVSEIRDPGRRALVERRMERIAERTVPTLAKLRRSVIHGDANDHNVLVRSTVNAGGQSVRGLIDFGDLVRSATIGEVAIAATYAMFGKRDPLGAAARLLAGYDSAYPVPANELPALFDLIALRACTSVAISAHSRRDEPDNAYLGVSEEAAFALLEHIDTQHPEYALAVFRHACGLEPCPRSRRVRAWIERHAAGFAPVLDLDLRATDVHRLDLSVASPLLAEIALEEGGSDPARAIPVPSGVAVGRWNEARGLYTDASFDAPGDDGPEARTIHIGIDLFRPAGTPVHAPLEGHVHGLADNAGHLDYGPTVVLRHEPEPGLVFHTLYGHLGRACLVDLKVGDAVRRGERIAELGDAGVNGGWAPHVHFQIVTHPLGRRGEFPGVALPRDAALWRSFSPDPSRMLGLEPEEEPGSRPELRARRERVLSGALSLSYARPLTIVRGSGTFLYDARGRAYLDAVNNVPHVGHAHPRVVRAGREQMALLNTNTRYLHPRRVEYVEQLLATFPPSLEVCFLVNSGSEANELALRLARAHTGERDLVVIEGGYHGNTGALVEASHYKYAGPGGFEPPPHVRAVRLPDPYRGPYGASDPDAGARYADDVRAACDQVRAAGRGVAAFLCEALLGCGGQVVPPAGYLAAAFEHARAAGGLCISDEVQIGFGRVGTHFWAFEEQGVLPDVVTLGKPIGNGHPLGAVVTTRAVAESFEGGMEYFNTFGGNPVSCAIGKAVLDVIADEGLQENARASGERLMHGLRALMERFPLIGDVRGRGLYVGAELVLDRATRRPAGEHAAHVAERLREKCVLISTDGPHHNVLKIKPPIVFGAREVDRLLGALEEVLGETALEI